MNAPDPTPPPRPRLLIPYTVLAVSLIATFAAAWYVATSAAAKDRARFENSVERTQVAISRRIENYVNLLRGGGALFAIQKHVTRAQFHGYVERLGLHERYPGIQGMGVAARTTPAARDDLIARLRAEGQPDFKIYPADPQREEFYPIIYLEPQDERNQAAVGFDMFTEPVRRAAMEKARDDGIATTSGIVTLKQEIDENKQAGFLIYVPIYYLPATPLTVELRRLTLAGYCYAPFRADDLLAGIFGSERFTSGIAFTVYDGQETTPQNLLHASDSIAIHEPQDSRFIKASRLKIPNREWTIVYRSGPGFESNSSRGITILVLAAGAIVSVLLFALTAAQAAAQRRAEESAEQLRRAKEAAESARADAEQASRLKDEFLATVSHELRTPLNAILGWAQLLRCGHDSPGDLEHGLETIERSSRAQAQLIDDLLDVSRIIAGKVRLDMQPVQPTDVIEAALASVRPAADAKGLRLTPTLDPTAGPVQADPHRLQQIVWNLLSNAVKFTPRGGQVTIALKRHNSEAQVIVTDSGIGIAPEFLPHVFERFRQADASTTRRYSGLGLGLGIARYLAELHGGTLEAHSDGEGKGSRFTLSLPLAIAHTPARLPPADHKPPPRGTSLQGIRVLLVEDDRDARELTIRMLHDQGADATAAASAAEAMQIFPTLRPDVLVSDIGMPEEDGYSLLARIRSLSPEAGGSVPAIALTALARPEDRRRALLEGFQVHVSKPVEAAELTMVIANLVNNKGTPT